MIVALANILGGVAILKLVSPYLKCLGAKGENLRASGKIHLKLTASILFALTTGILLDYFVINEELARLVDGSISYTLGVLLFAVGISLGLNKSIFKQVSRLGWQIILPPLSISAGIILGPLIVSFAIRLSPVETAAVGAGFSWYSLSVILLTKLHSPELGSIAFLVNTLEIFSPSSRRLLRQGFLEGLQA